MSSGICFNGRTILQDRTLKQLGIKKIPQKESQKINYILHVLEYIIKNHETSAVKLKKALPISRDSIDRTIIILLDKNIIKFKERKSRGEKIFVIKSEESAKQYRERLLEWKSIKAIKQNLMSFQNISKLFIPMKKLGKQLKLEVKKYSQRERYITKEILVKPWQIDTKEKQQLLTNIPWPTPVTLNEMKAKQAIKIMDDYLEGNLCDICFKENKLSSIQLNDMSNEMICRYGHVSSILTSSGISFETLSDDASKLRQTKNLVSRRKPIPKWKRKSPLSDREFEYQKEKYLQYGKIIKPTKIDIGPIKK